MTWRQRQILEFHAISEILLRNSLRQSSEQWLMTAPRAAISRHLALLELLGCGVGRQQQQVQQLYRLLSACYIFEF